MAGRAARESMGISLTIGKSGIFSYPPYLVPWRKKRPVTRCDRPKRRRIAPLGAFHIRTGSLRRGADRVRVNANTALHNLVAPGCAVAKRGYQQDIGGNLR